MVLIKESWKIMRIVFYLLSKMRPRLTASEAANRIKEMTGIERSTQQVRVFMKRHGLKFVKCGHMPAKANNEAQHNWVETELKPVIEAARQGNVHLFFCDAAHFVMAPFLCRLWCAVRVLSRASAGRNRINVLGAVNAITREVITLTNTTYIDSNVLIEFLKMLKQKFAYKPIASVLDNAWYQHCFVIKTMARSLGIHLQFLPPYSPKLNIIERLWKFKKNFFMPGIMKTQKSIMRLFKHSSIHLLKTKNPN